MYGGPRMRRKHPSKESREKIPWSQDKECALLRNSESGQCDQRVPGRGAQIIQALTGHGKDLGSNEKQGMIWF